VVKRYKHKAIALAAITSDERRLIALAASALLAALIVLLTWGPVNAQSSRDKSGKPSAKTLTLEHHTTTTRSKSGKILASGLDRNEDLVATNFIKDKSGKDLTPTNESEFESIDRGQMQAPPLNCNTLSISLALASGDTLQRKFKLTMRAIRDFVDFENRHGKKTATVPLGSDDKLFVDADALWYDVMSGKGDAVQFGPYMTNWQRVPSSVGSGHYGVQLGVPW